MIPVLLLDELCLFLNETVKQYWLATKYNTEKPPQVVPGWLPPQEAGRDDMYAALPYVVPRLVEGEDQQTGSVATVRILFGVYSENADGWRDLLNLIEHVRQALFRKRLLAKKFYIEFPAEWKIPDDQPYPEWVGFLTTRWTIAQPLEEVDYGDEYFKD